MNSTPGNSCCILNFPAHVKNNTTDWYYMKRQITSRAVREHSAHLTAIELRRNTMLSACNVVRLRAVYVTAVGGLYM